MSLTLSHAMRPRTFEELIGQEKLIKKIRGHYAQDRMPKAWMFTGETGSGKTTIARIMAVSLQCRHAERFGTPCDRCIKRASKYDITEINGSDLTTVDVIRNTLQSYDLSPGPGSRRRIFILDECHRLSKGSQNLLLKYFEDCPSTTVWFICTTEPDKVLRTLRRRCLVYTMLSLDMDSIKVLVRKALRYVRSDLASNDLVEALYTNTVTSSGLVVNAVEKYVAGSTAEEAARVEESNFDTEALCHALVKGDLEQCMKQLSEATAGDCRMIRQSVAGYLKSIILNETDVAQRTKAVADSIYDLAVHSYEDGLQIPITVAAIYKCCERFKKYGH